NIDISAFLRVFNFQHKEKRLKKIVQNGLFLQSKQTKFVQNIDKLLKYKNLKKFAKDSKS
ncbi:hypothetical protein, partial [Streptococcus suis]|uniref:hypothetical protein n=1 Tax=Streptococcus suis TaxID=1307 RepID=UPI001B355EDC